MVFKPVNSVDNRECTVFRKKINVDFPKLEVFNLTLGFSLENWKAALLLSVTSNLRAGSSSGLNLFYFIVCIKGVPEISVQIFSKLYGSLGQNKMNIHYSDLVSVFMKQISTILFLTF